MKNSDCKTIGLDDWHLVNNWWPIPVFVFNILGEDGCRKLVGDFFYRKCRHKFLISFALALENRTQAISSVADLERALSKICEAGYEFNDANLLQEAMSKAFVARRDSKYKGMSDEWAWALHPQDSFNRRLAEKNLPDGRHENLALIRSILGVEKKSE